VEDISSQFSDEFPEEETPLEVGIFQVGNPQSSEFRDIIEYLMTRRYPEGITREEKSVFQYKVAPYTLVSGVLFRMGADDKIRRCLEPGERKGVMEALHAGDSGGHLATMSTVNRIKSAGYWWPFIIRDVRKFIRSCDQCQRTGAPRFRNHWPLTPIVPLAPFVKWGIDFVGPITPISSGRKRYIILATDYATKWVEARATRKNDARTAAGFLFEEIMMRFGYPLELVSDRGKHFLNDVVVDITTKYAIKHRKTTPYNPKANGLTERSNGIVGKILNKMVSAHKTDWDRKLASAIHAYNTSEKTTTGKTPYFMVFGQEAVHGIELTVETYRIMAARLGVRVEDPALRLLAIEDLEEGRAEALERNRWIQASRKESFDDRLPADHGIRKGGLVLLYDSRHQNFPGKLHTRWMGPYRVTETFSNGSLQLEDLEGKWMDTRVNGSRVKKYYPESVSEEDSISEREDSRESSSEE